MRRKVYNPMNMWEILKIEKTKSEAVVKSSFTKLRGTVPSDQVKLLTKANEFALRYVFIKDSTDSFKEELLVEMAFERYCEQNTPKAAADPNANSGRNTGSLLFGSGLRSSLTSAAQPPRKKEWEDFWWELQKTYDNFFSRREIANWEGVLQRSATWNADKANLETLVLDFLQKNSNIPADVFRLFDKTYQWENRIFELAASNKDFARCYLIATCPRWAPDYAFIKRDVSFDYEGYIKYRGLTREAALDNDLDKTRENFDNAINIYPHEPRLYEITAEFYESQPAFNKYGEFGPEYLHSLNKLIKFHFDDRKYLPLRAEYYKRCEYFEEAREDYSQAMKITPEDLSIPFEIAESYMLQELSSKAKSFLKHIKKVYQKTQTDLEKQWKSSPEQERITKLIDSNERIISAVYDQLNA